LRRYLQVDDWLRDCIRNHLIDKDDRWLMGRQPTGYHTFWHLLPNVGVLGDTWHLTRHRHMYHQTENEHRWVGLAFHSLYFPPILAPRR
jgi:hypothetical protein